MIKGRWSDYVITPPHTTHEVQPLDVGVFKPLQTYYDQDIEKWLRADPGRGITTFCISQLRGLRISARASYIKAATMVNAVNGFRMAGIWHCDRHIFDHEFEADTATPPQVKLAFRYEMNLSYWLALILQ